MDFKDSLDAWNKSPFYKRFKKQLEENKQQIISSALKNKTMEHTPKINYTDDELEVMLDNIIIFDYIPDDEKKEYSYLSHALTEKLNKTELFFEFIKKINLWTFYLKKKLNEENYELCQKLHQVIQIETKDFKSNLKERFFYADEIDWFEDFQTVDEVVVEIKNKYQI